MVSWHFFVFWFQILNLAPRNWGGMNDLIFTETCASFFIFGVATFVVYDSLHGGFKHFLFSPLVREMIQFDLYFSNGLKPPTRIVLVTDVTERNCSNYAQLLLRKNNIYSQRVLGIFPGQIRRRMFFRNIKRVDLFTRMSMELSK